MDTTGSDGFRVFTLLARSSAQSTPALPGHTLAPIPRAPQLKIELKKGNLTHKPSL